MYLRRKVDEFLDRWHADAARLPILIRGARQIGKTEAVRQFAKRTYDSLVEVNFVESPKFKSIVQDGYGAQEVVSAISRIESSFKFPRNRRTLIFFDEVQEFPDIATSLKFFAQGGDYDVICSGSLLGIHYRSITSNSVGFKLDYEMSSLDFEEFLWARGYGDDLVDEMLRSLRERMPLRASTLQAVRGLFLDYSTLGGMPYIVRRYIETRSFEGSLEAQRRIVGDYRDDVRKYVKGLDQTRILNVLDHIPVQLAREQNRKFQISKVAHGARAREYEGCVNWLVQAGVVNRCHCLRAPTLPLAGNYDESKFKLYMGDTGLLVGMMERDVADDVRVNRNLGVWKGGLYENIVAEALRKSGRELYYWRRGESPLEIDFLVRCGDRIVPLEVKGGNDRAKSLRELIASPKYPEVSWGVKMADANIGFEGNVLTMPWACAFLLDRLLSGEKAREPLPWFEPGI